MKGSGTVPPRPAISTEPTRTWSKPGRISSGRRACNPWPARSACRPAALEATVAEYNSAVEAGQTARLNPTRTAASYKPFPIANPPFYGLRLCAGLTFTMGGIAVDEVGRVLNERNEAIPGLYAAGCCTGGLDGGPSAGYVGGLAKSAAMGINTADHLAATLRASSWLDRFPDKTNGMTR